MELINISDNIFKIDGKLATKNLITGHKVYGEELIQRDGIEYRFWNPYRSKLAAAILKGLKTIAIKDGICVLYLGVSTGTTSSHVSDIIGINGRLFGVEISKRSMREFLNLCELRHNMLPILGDAMVVDNYKDLVKEGSCDVIYQDVSARDQSGILKANSIFLKKGGIAYFIIKSQSIDVGKKPEEVFEDELDKLKDVFDIVEKIDINPFDKLHMFAVLKKK